jgi:DUF1009 family protein
MPVPLKLGMIAGGGDLPATIIEACRAGKRPLFVAAIKGACAPGTVEGTAHMWFEIGAVGQLLDALRRENCRDVVMAGPVKRPEFAALKADWQGIKLLPRVVKAAAKGDNAIFKTLVRFLEDQGFRVIGADDVVAELLAPVGAIGRFAPSGADLADIERGRLVVNALGALDVGQAAVVRQGVVLGVEAVEGTNQLLQRCAELAPSGRAGVLVKMPKPGQERRVDLPTVGPPTVEHAIAARLNGIAFEAKGVLIMGRDRAVRTADGNELFLFGFPAGGPQ